MSMLSVFWSSFLNFNPSVTVTFLIIVHLRYLTVSRYIIGWLIRTHQRKNVSDLSWLDIVAFIGLINLRCGLSRVCDCVSLLSIAKIFHVWYEYVEQTLGHLYYVSRYMNVSFLCSNRQNKAKSNWTHMVLSNETEGGQIGINCIVRFNCIAG